MRRAMVLAVVLVGGVAAMSVAALQQAPMVLEVEKVKDNLFVLRGGGGNTAVFVQGSGVTVVDTKNPGWGQPLLAKIRELTDKPVVRIINTHTHGDHVSGNVDFPATVDIVTHENTAANMKKMAMPPGFQSPPAGTPTVFESSQGRGLPKTTYKERLSLGSGPDRVELYYFGRGHTNGDTWVLFPTARVVHAGDMFPSRNVPLLDTNNGGSGVEIPATLAKASATLGKEADRIITGHGALMTPKDLQDYASFNRDFLEFVRAGKKAGKSVDRIAAEWKVPAQYTGYDTPQADRLKRNVEVVFGEIP